MPYSDSVLYSEMTDFQKELMIKANDIFPEEYDKFLKKEGRKLSKIQKKIAQRDVGETEDNNEIIIRKVKRKGIIKEEKAIRDYHDCFKVGKLYKVNDMRCIRAYNSARHGHLIEYGHKKWIRGKNTGQYVLGKNIMKKAELEFQDKFLTDSEKFLQELFSDFKGSRV